MYTDARTAIMNDLDDKVQVSMMKQGPSISTTNKFQTLSTGERSPWPTSTTGKVKAKAGAKEGRNVLELW